MTMIRALVAGPAGRMGGRIIAALEGHQRIVLAGAFERKGHPAVGRDAGEAAGIGKKKVPVEEELESIIGSGDVLIDFTNPEASVRNISVAARFGKAVVLGTTGLDGDQLAELEQAARKVPVVFAPNMSVGVNLLFNVLADVARILGETYDVEIVEAHHRFKKDAPSGTARKMAEVIAAALGRDPSKVTVPGRSGMIGERKREEIGVMSLRGGDIIGEHTVVFAGLGERLELTHRAHSRDTFARGAVRAAEWVNGRVPGLYTMMNVLGLKEQEFS